MLSTGVLSASDRPQQDPLAHDLQEAKLPVMLSTRRPPAGTDPILAEPSAPAMELDPLDHTIPTLGERVADLLRERIVGG